MEAHSFSASSHTLQTVVFTTLIIAACLIFPKLNYWTHLSKLPTLGSVSSGTKQHQAYLRAAKKLYKEGYDKVMFLSSLKK
jgi:hypothetical protein